MKTRVIILLVCLSAYFEQATTDVETVWLKDVTTRLKTDKRTFSDTDLPDQLSFQLKTMSRTLTLNLKRNFQIDPNVDIYTMNKLNDGLSFLEKEQYLEKEDVAYYQDIENGAFMTARCVRRSNGQCKIQINGNIQIRDKIYDLEPSGADVTSRDFMEITGLLGERYDLKEQGNIQMEMPVEIKDKIRNIARFYIEVIVVTDSSIYDLFLSMSTSPNPIEREKEARKQIRAYFLHVMNGVDLLYRGIEHPGMKINIIVRSLVVLQMEHEFQHNVSRVTHYITGEKMINVSNYLEDLKQADIRIHNSGIPAYDQVILFTKYMLESVTGRKRFVKGHTVRGGICDLGSRVQICHVGDYFETVNAAAQELGYALGAYDDGSSGAKYCKARDGYIMTNIPLVFVPGAPYSRNPWLFSKCSVKAFIRTAKSKACLKSKGAYSQEEINEWATTLSKEAGELFSPNDQCHIINGPGSIYCGSNPSMICRFMHCTDPKTGQCDDTYLNAATGTSCGENNWCKEGLCVPKGSSSSNE